MQLISTESSVPGSWPGVSHHCTVYNVCNTDISELQHKGVWLVIASLYPTNITYNMCAKNEKKYIYFEYLRYHKDVIHIQAGNLSGNPQKAAAVRVWSSPGYEWEGVTENGQVKTEWFHMRMIKNDVCL